MQKTDVSFLKSILPFLEKLYHHQTLTYQSRVMQILTIFALRDFDTSRLQSTHISAQSTSYSGYQTAFQSSYERPQQTTATYQKTRKHPWPDRQIQP